VVFHGKPTSRNELSDKDSYINRPILSGWLDDHNNLHKRKFEAFRIAPIPANPLFLGVIANNINITMEEGFPAATWKAIIEQNLQTYLSKNKLPVGSNTIATNPFIANIDYLGPLPIISHMLGRAIFDVNEEIIEQFSIESLINRMCGVNPLILKKIVKEHPSFPKGCLAQWDSLTQEYRREIQKLIEKLP